MNVYVFEDVAKLTGSYHCSGGLVVIARDIEHVKELVSVDNFISPTEQEYASVKSYPIAGNAEPVVYIFPDAGCC